MKTLELNPGDFVLASLLTGYPDEGLVYFLQRIQAENTLNLPPDLRDRCLALTAGGSSALEDLGAEYVSQFEVSKDRISLYETEYGRERRMFKTNELSDIAGFYRAFGFEPDETGVREMVDHVAVELEFYSLMMMKFIHLQKKEDEAGMSIVMDAMKKFLEGHLGRLVIAIADSQSITGFYLDVFTWVNSLVLMECKRLGVAPKKLIHLQEEGLDGEVCCSVNTGTVS